MKKIANLIFGIILVLVGCLFIINTLGIFDIGIIGLASDYWPLFLILAGISLIFKKKNLAGLFLVIMFVTLIVGVFDGFSINEPNYRLEKQEFIMNDSIKNLEMNIEFGLGMIDIKKNDKNKTITVIANHTGDMPDSRYEEKADLAVLKLEREENQPDFVFAEEKWEILIDQETTKSLELDYGISDVKLDLRDLNIKNLKISCGVSDNTIIFDDNNIEVRFEGGITDTDFFFPENLGVRIDTDTGLSDFDMEGFKKSGTVYISNNYDDAENKAHIRIEAGLSGFVSKFYEEGDEI